MSDRFNCRLTIRGPEDQLTEFCQRAIGAGLRSRFGCLNNACVLGLEVFKPSDHVLESFSSRHGFQWDWYHNDQWNRMWDVSLFSRGTGQGKIIVFRFRCKSPPDKVIQFVSTLYPDLKFSLHFSGFICMSNYTIVTSAFYKNGAERLCHRGFSHNDYDPEDFIPICTHGPQDLLPVEAYEGVFIDEHQDEVPFIFNDSIEEMGREK